MNKLDRSRITMNKLDRSRIRNLPKFSYVKIIWEVFADNLVIM